MRRFLIALGILLVLPAFCAAEMTSPAASTSDPVKVQTVKAKKEPAKTSTKASKSSSAAKPAKSGSTATPKTR